MTTTTMTVEEMLEREVASYMTEVATECVWNDPHDWAIEYMCNSDVWELSEDAVEAMANEHMAHHMEDNSLPWGAKTVSDIVTSWALETLQRYVADAIHAARDALEEAHVDDLASLEPYRTRPPELAGAEAVSQRDADGIVTWFVFDDPDDEDPTAAWREITLAPGAVAWFTSDWWLDDADGLTLLSESLGRARA